MSEKDIKTKPKISPKANEKTSMLKVAVKSKNAVVNTVKDAKAVVKDNLVKKAVETKLGTEQEQAQPQKADTEAAESVESAAYTAADTVYHKGKTFTQNKIREHRANNVKTKEEYLNNNSESFPEQTEEPHHELTTSKEKGEQVKTRENAENPSDTHLNQSPKGVVKSGSVYTSKTAKRKTVKTTKKAVKTQKEVTKKAAKEAAKRARQLAQKSAQAAKAVAVKTAKTVAAISKAIAAAATKAATAFVAAFGWIGVVVVLVILIVVIIIAAIAGSPFGIFLSDEAADANSIPVSSIVNECNIELSSRLTEIEDNTTHDRIVMEGEQADWGLVLSLFSVKVAGVDDETVQDVVVIDDAKKEKLKQVFWDMHTITSRTETVTSGETSEIVLYITITAKTKDEMVSQYGFTQRQKEALETLLENADGYIGTTQSLAISDATAQEVIDNLPDSLSNERKTVVKKACSLVGKLTYFWGGKSSAIGWDSEWGKMKLVTAEGSRSTGCMRPYGLDCSGFVTWSFINAGYSASAIGHGTNTQVSKGTRITLSSAQPGDLAFYNDISHVGIVGGKDSSGNILVIHCSSSANNVVITTGGFGFAVKPNCY